MHNAKKFSYVTAKRMLMFENSTDATQVDRIKRIVCLIHTTRRVANYSNIIEYIHRELREVVCDPR